MTYLDTVMMFLGYFTAGCIVGIIIKAVVAKVVGGRWG